MYNVLYIIFVFLYIICTCTLVLHLDTYKYLQLYSVISACAKYFIYLFVFTLEVIKTFRVLTSLILSYFDKPRDYKKLHSFLLIGYKF